MQGVADYMRNSDWNRLRGDCENIAHRHPVAFFGGMFLAGLVGANLIKASQSKAEDYDYGYDYDESQSRRRRPEPQSPWTQPAPTPPVANPEIPTAAPSVGM
jgi:hypothetical protein